MKISQTSFLDKLVLTGFFLSGFAALTYEQVWTQLLILVYGASTFAFSAMLTSFFLGMAIGSHFMGKKVDNLKMPILWFCFLELGIGISGLLLLPVFSKLDIPYLVLYHWISDPDLFILSWFIIPIILVVPTTLMGATLPLVSRLFASRTETVGGDIGLIYSANTMGGIVGSFSAGFLLIPFIGVEKATLLASFSNILVSGVLFMYASKLIFIQVKGRAKLPRSYVGMRTVFYSLLVFSFFSVSYFATYSIDPGFAGAYYVGMRLPSVEDWERAKEGFDTLYSKYGLYGLVTVGTDGVDHYLSVNGKTEASTGPADASTQYLISYLPLMMHENPRDALNIGLGAGFTLSAMENFDELETIDCVEIDPLIVDLADTYFSDYTHDILDDPRLEIIIADGRNWLAHSDRIYDVIISEPSNPWISGEGSLFTKEYFEIVEEHLRPGGIFCQWAPMYEHDSQDFKILLKTFMSAFPYVEVYNSGTDIILMGSNQEMEFDYQRVVAKLEDQRIKEDFSEMEEIFTMGFDVTPMERLFHGFKMGTEVARAYVADEGIPLNTDDTSILEFRTAINSARRRYHTQASEYIEPLEDIIKFGEKVRGTPVVVPPITNLVSSDGQTDTITFLNVKVHREPAWRLETHGIEYIHRVHEDMLTYTSSKYARYDLQDQGKLAIIPLEGFGMPDPEELSLIIQDVFGADSSTLVEYTVVGPHKGLIYEMSLGGGIYRGMTLVWASDEPTTVFLAAVVYPSTVWDPARAYGDLQRVECICEKH